ncbi:hypothetical protein B0H14DRAFT_1109601, partial [Mycena olivaceomarginata]
TDQTGTHNSHSYHGVQGPQAFLFNRQQENKTSKKHQITTNISNPLLPISEADDSFGATELLRSSSARYAVANEVDYSSLPPLRECYICWRVFQLTFELLAHPINHVLPTSSTVSLASAATSISSTSRGTYTVTVHGRKHHTRTEFPNANRDLDDEPTRNNNSQLLRLHSDPSVASLLSLYDEHGRLPARAFSNSPPKEGRAQVQRSGSTLRQLLGNPASSVNSCDDAGALEGDISWAERFLGETASMISSTSSRGLGTPDTDSHFPHTPLQSNPRQLIRHRARFSSSMQENPAISSLEVELSDLSDLAETPPRPSHNSPYAVPDPKTPQRASQVFGFLTDKRRSRAPEDDERSLPELPSTFSSPSDEGSPPVLDRSRSHFSSDSSADSIEPPAPAPVPFTPVDTQFRFRPTHTDAPTVKAANDVHIIMAHGPTKVIVTAPTPSYHHDNTAPTRIPRGPARASPTTHESARSSGLVHHGPRAPAHLALELRVHVDGVRLRLAGREGGAALAGEARRAEQEQTALDPVRVREGEPPQCETGAAAHADPDWVDFATVQPGASGAPPRGAGVACVVGGAVDSGGAADDGGFAASSARGRGNRRRSAGGGDIFSGAPVRQIYRWSRQIFL